MKELELLCSMKEVSFDGSDLENVVLALRLVAGCGVYHLGKVLKKIGYFKQLWIFIEFKSSYAGLKLHIYINAY